MYWTTKLAIMPILPTLCVCEKLACSFGDEISNRTTSDTNTVLFVKTATKHIDLKSPADIHSLAECLT